MASHHVRGSSCDAPEVYHPPPTPTVVPDQHPAPSVRAAFPFNQIPTPPSDYPSPNVLATQAKSSPQVYYPPPASAVRGSIDGSRHHATHANEGLHFNHLPTPPAEYTSPDCRSHALAESSPLIQQVQDQRFSSLSYSDPAPDAQSSQSLNQFPPTPISPQSSHLHSASSPGYFQTTYQSQYYPPPPATGDFPASQQPQPQPQPQQTYHSSCPNTGPYSAVTPAGGDQFTPNYTPQRTTSPQQYYPPPPSLPDPNSYGSQFKPNDSSNLAYFAPPLHPSTSFTQPSVASLPYLPAYTPVQHLASPMINAPQPFGAAYQQWPSSSAQSLPNAYMTPNSNSPHLGTPHDISTSFSNLSIANQAPVQGSAADDVTEHWSKRFVGNTLAGRVVRASVKSVSATVQLPMYLSPWGDNNPVTLPNVRRRDAALAVVGHFGADALAPSALEMTGEVFKFGATQAVEKTVDDGIHHFTPGKALAVQHRAGVRTTQVKIKHKLMGSDANLRYVGGRPAVNQKDCSKGWFCPLLFASGRTPSIPRANDFAVAEFHGPGLNADKELARNLVTLLSQESPVAGLRSTDPKSSNAPHRLLVLLLGMSPCRTQAWSQARIPGEGRLQLHLFTGVPAFVIPVTAKAPIFAWSAWTLKQIHGNNGKGGAYSAENHYHELCNYLESVLSLEPWGPPHPPLAEYRQMVWSLVQSSLGTQGLGQEAMSAIDTERAGIVMLRY